MVGLGCLVLPLSYFFGEVGVFNQGERKTSGGREECIKHVLDGPGWQNELESYAAHFILCHSDMPETTDWERNKEQMSVDRTLCHVLHCGAMDSDTWRWQHYGHLATRSRFLQYKAKKDVSARPTVEDAGWS